MSEPTAATKVVEAARETLAQSPPAGGTVELCSEDFVALQAALREYDEGECPYCKSVAQLKETAPTVHCMGCGRAIKRDAAS